MGLIAAEALDVPLAKVDVVWGDTDRCPYSVGESGSRTTIMTGTAVVEAARDIQKQVADKGMPAGDQVYVASASPSPRLEGQVRASFGAHFCEVEVDTELGDVRVTKYTTVHDSGRLMNPLSAKGQIAGAVIQGIGMALHEDMVYDRRSGQPLTGGYYSARVATHLDAPDVEVTFLENDDGYGPFGAKSIGEAGIILAPACVANAIFNAIGRRMKDTPITRARIINALGAPRMKAFTNANARDARHAATLAREARAAGDAPRLPAAAATCSALVKDRIVAPDVIVRLTSITGADRVEPSAVRAVDRRTDHARHAEPRRGGTRHGTRCWPKPPRRVATPQIRNVGTLAGNVCQRPWCWYYRNGFPCYKAGRQPVLLGGRRERVPRHLRRRSELHRPSVGYGAGVDGARRDVPHQPDPTAIARVAASEFFTLPRQNAATRERARRRRGADRGADSGGAGRARAAPTRS